MNSENALDRSGVAWVLLFALVVFAPNLFWLHQVQGGNAEPIPLAANVAFIPVVFALSSRLWGRCCIADFICSARAA